MEEAPYHIDFLKSELSARKEKNPRYSLCAFSRFLKMDPSALSRILSGKQKLSPKACPAILDALRASAADCELFIASVLADKERIEFAAIARKIKAEVDLKGRHTLGDRELRIGRRHLSKAQAELEDFLIELEKRYAPEAVPSESKISVRLLLAGPSRPLTF